MLIGILSDTHDQVERTKLAVATLARPQERRPCSTAATSRSPMSSTNAATFPAYFVFGNCDFDRESLRQAITAIGGTCLERGDDLPWRAVGSP